MPNVLYVELSRQDDVKKSIECNFWGVYHMLCMLKVLLNKHSVTMVVLLLIHALLFIGKVYFSNMLFNEVMQIFEHFSFRM